MTIGELIELLKGILEVLVEFFSQYFGGDEEADGEETTAAV